MALQKITIGDDAGLTCTLSRGGNPVSINTGATVRAAIVTTDKSQRMTAIETIGNADVGNDWANGVVRVVIPAASQYSDQTESATIKNIVTGLAMVEVEVNDSTQPAGNKINTWHEAISIDAAGISA